MKTKKAVIDIKNELTLDRFILAHLSTNIQLDVIYKKLLLIENKLNANTNNKKSRRQ